ncbi:MAG: TonB-dependent receptor, partial [Bacteroidetes bacterium]
MHVSRIILLSFWGMAICTPLAAQTQRITGHVHGVNEQAQMLPLLGASVYVLPSGPGAFTDSLGRFEIEAALGARQLIVSFAGYRRDTVEIDGEQELQIHLRQDYDLAEVKIEATQASTRINPLTPMRTEILGQAELSKAACCNLAESFETNPSVDASFTDALTGTRQIQLLGLAGPYTQITRENLPAIRGLSTGIGLDYIPGPWLESIQVSKGAGSVVNGYEAIAGQINVEMRKSDAGEKLFVNAYAGQGGRFEANVTARAQLTPGISTAVLAHGSTRQQVHDRNDDSFLDMPFTRQAGLINRWQFYSRKGWEAQAGVSLLDDLRQAGQMAFWRPGMHEVPVENPDDPHFGHAYGVQIRTRRQEAWTKTGYVFPGKPYQSFGLQLSVQNHDQQSFYGNTSYSGRERTGYANLIFQSIIGTSDHQYRVGASYLYDQFDERLRQVNYTRTESVPGVFAEYTYTYLTKFSLVAGLRADRHNLFGLFLTPRLFLRYMPDSKTTLRFSAGRGQRTANIFAENAAVFVSSREVEILSGSNTGAYGLQPEVAWNTGLNLTRTYRIDGRPGDLAVEYYYTNFRNQVVADYDFNPQMLRFSNLEGASFAHNFQVTANYEIRRRMNVRVAWKRQEVRTTYHGTLMLRPLTPLQRAFFNIEYKTRDGWHFDYTLQFTGKQRLPDTRQNPVEYRLPEYAKGFLTMHA